MWKKKLLMDAVICQKEKKICTGSIFSLIMGALRAPDKNVNLIQL